jgi:hypothetical protein
MMFIAYVDYVLLKRPIIFGLIRHQRFTHWEPHDEIAELRVINTDRKRM